MGKLLKNVQNYLHHMNILMNISLIFSLILTEEDKYLSKVSPGHAQSERLEILFDKLDAAPLFTEAVEAFAYWETASVNMEKHSDKLTQSVCSLSLPMQVYILPVYSCTPASAVQHTRDWPHSTMFRCLHYTPCYLQRS